MSNHFLLPEENSQITISPNNSFNRLSHHVFNKDSPVISNIDYSLMSTSKYTNKPSSKLSVNKAHQGSPVSARDFFYNNVYECTKSENEFVMGNDERLSLGTRINSSKKVR